MWTGWYDFQWLTSSLRSSPSCRRRGRHRTEPWVSTSWHPISTHRTSGRRLVHHTTTQLLTTVRAGCCTGTVVTCTTQAHARIHFLLPTIPSVLYYSIVFVILSCAKVEITQMQRSRFPPPARDIEMCDNFPDLDVRKPLLSTTVHSYRCHSSGSATGERVVREVPRVQIGHR